MIMAQVSLSQFSPSFNSSSNISNNSSYRSISSGGGELGACSADSSPVHPSKSPDIAALEKLSESIESLLSIADLDCSDAEIVVQDRAVPVHRCILAARSPFFREKLFPSTRPESQAASAKLRYELKDWLTEGNVGYEAFRILLAYLYSGKVKAPPTEVCICMDSTCVHDACRPAVDFTVELMYAAHVFQIPELVSLSQRRLLNFVERAQVEDVIPILIAANVCETGNDQLLTRCIHRVGRSDLDNVALEKELPQEVVKRVKEFRSSLGVATFPSSSQQKNIQRIQRALDSDDVELVKLLLQEGEGKITLDDAYALHYAAAYCDPKITSELLEIGCADVNLKNPRGYTVLHIAAMRREPATIVALLTKGAQPSELTFDERTALQIAKRLTRAIDCYRTTDEGKESPKDRLCIEILERAESRNPLRAEAFSFAFGGEDMRTKLLDLENRAHWWIDCGTEARQLQEFAIIFLSQPCNASSCELNWLVFEHIHNEKRHKLEHERLEKLVFIYYNLRMLTKQVQPKDLDPILLDNIDLEFDWVVEESPVLSWLDEETEDLSSLPSQMETPNTLASQLFQPSDVGTSSMRAYCRHSCP